LQAENIEFSGFFAFFRLKKPKKSGVEHLNP
jgi:hypothetical protein